MKKLLSVMFTLSMCLPIAAQVSNNNEDEVYKMTSTHRHAMDFVPGEVLVKMKDASPVTVRRVKGKFQQTSSRCSTRTLSCRHQLRQAVETARLPD